MIGVLYLQYIQISLWDLFNPIHCMCFLLCWLWVNISTYHSLLYSIEYNLWFKIRYILLMCISRSIWNKGIDSSKNTSYCIFTTQVSNSLTLIYLFADLVRVRITAVLRKDRSYHPFLMQWTKAVQHVLLKK